MTPAINLLKKNKNFYKLHTYQVSNQSESYGEEAAKALNLPLNRVFKTLVVSLNGDDKNLAVGIVPVNSMLDLKAIAKHLKGKRAEMAKEAVAERTTGYVVGGISPLGQKKRLPTAIDASVEQFETIFVSAGKRGLQVEIKPKDLLELTNAVLGNISITNK